MVMASYLKKFATNLVRRGKEVKSILEATDSEGKLSVQVQSWAV